MTKSPRPLEDNENEAEATTPTPRSGPGMDAQLEFAKWLAIITMVIDHVGYLFHDKVDYVLWRSAGRLCWPLIAWIVAMRLAAVPQRTGGYLKRLLPWAVISQIPYAFMFSFTRNLPWHDAFNILFTIALGCMIFMLLIAMATASRRRQILMWGGILLLLAVGIKVDYGSVGVASIPVMALLARQSPKRAAIACGILAAMANVFILAENGILAQYILLAIAPLGASLIALYCLDVYLPVPRLPRWFFYLFYPLHMVALLAALLIFFAPPAATTP